MTKEELLQSYYRVLESTDTSSLTMKVSLIQTGQVIVAIAAVIMMIWIYKKNKPNVYPLVIVGLLVVLQVSGLLLADNIKKNSVEDFVQATVPKLQVWAIEVFEKEYIPSLPVEKVDVETYTLDGNHPTINKTRIKNEPDVKRSLTGSDYMEARWVDVPEIASFLKTPYYTDITLYVN